jgi:CRISPR-associated protein Cas5t
MEVLRIIAEGPTTSFRYPHFMQGVHPTYEMPPPATIYGHICSTLGEWVQPEGILFGYHFTYSARFDDVEHALLLTKSTGRLEGTGLPKVASAGVVPFKRMILFRPKLMLYINRPEWESSFRSPRYPVALGRSQDLFTYTDVRLLDMQTDSTAYFEHTLLPYGMNLQTGAGYAVLMPRYLDYQRRRAPVFERYLVLKRRVHSDELVKVNGLREPRSYLVDATTEEDRGAHLGIVFHSFIGDEGGDGTLASLA